MCFLKKKPKVICAECRYYSNEFSPPTCKYKKHQRREFDYIRGESFIPGSCERLNREGECKMFVKKTFGDKFWKVMNIEGGGY